MDQSVVNLANSFSSWAHHCPLVCGHDGGGLNLVPKTSTPATVTFSGLSATISYDGAIPGSSVTQINVLVPAGLAANATANAGVIATIDGVASNTFPVSLVANAPAVFSPGILNQNNSVNLASAPASRGDIIQIFSHRFGHGDYCARDSHYWERSRLAGARSFMREPSRLFPVWNR